MTTPDHTTTTLDTIVVEKDKLLTKLRENREKHKAIYDAACDGFWIQSKEKLERRKGQFAEAYTKLQSQIEEVFTKGQTRFEEQYATFGMAVEKKDRGPLSSFSQLAGNQWSADFNTSWVPTYPTEYLEDYDRAISMLEFSVADKVNLSVKEFDAYVRNNWSWKTQFATTNLGLVCCTTGSMFALHGNSYLDSTAYAFACSGALSL